MRLGPVILQPYGFILSLAVLAGAVFFFAEVKRKKESPDEGLEILLAALTGGIIGSRLYHVIGQWSFYSQNPLAIFQIWRGGLGIYGGLLGGTLAIFIFTKIRKFDFPAWLDLAAVGIPLGQVVGRLANFVNQELYGYPTNLPWGIFISPENRLPQFSTASFFHPLFLYESLWSFLVFLAVLTAGRKFAKKFLKGELFLFYLSLYSFGRFWLEFLRPDPWRLFGFPTAQFLGLAVILFSLVLTLDKRLIWYRIKIKLNHINKNAAA